MGENHCVLKTDSLTGPWRDPYGTLTKPRQSSGGDLTEKSVSTKFCWTQWDRRIAVCFGYRGISRLATEQANKLIVARRHIDMRPSPTVLPFVPPSGSLHPAELSSKPHKLRPVPTPSVTNFLPRSFPKYPTNPKYPTYPITTTSFPAMENVQ